MTLEELKERIKWKWDEISFIEEFNISIEELLDRFEDKIEQNYDSLVVEFTDGEDDEL